MSLSLFFISFLSLAMCHRIHYEHTTPSQAQAQAPAATNPWTPVATASLLSGVATFDGVNVFATGFADGMGAVAIKSSDSGATWNSCNLSTDQKEAFDMPFSVAASTSTNVVIAGTNIGNECNQFTTDGMNFQPSYNLYFVQESQDIDPLPVAGGFAIVAEYADGVFGVSTSLDAGGFFNSTIVPTPFELQLRYGSYPTMDTWFLTVGTFPGDNATLARSMNLKQLSRKLDLPRTLTKDSKEFAKYHYASELKDQAIEQTIPWYGAILKTIDGGVTFTKVYENYTFYFNEISCATEKTCFAVGENDAGAFILKTNDGGSSWSQIYYQDTLSLMAVHALSETEAWAGGAIETDTTLIGHALHTTDGGKTWNTVTVNGYYFNWFSFYNSNVGYATAFDFLANDSFVLKYNPTA